MEFLTKRDVMDKLRNYGMELWSEDKRHEADIVGQCMDRIEKIYSINMDDWISVKDALPPDGEHVLCYYNYEEYLHIGWRHGERWETDLFDNASVDYWMPLPGTPAV